MLVVYVAGPYTNKDPWILHQNIENAKAAGREVALMGAMPCIPHSNTPAQFCGIQDYQFWIDGTMELLLRSDAVLMTPGWESSNGAKREWLRAMRENIPVFYACFPTEGVEIDGEHHAVGRVRGLVALAEYIKDVGPLVGGVKR